MTTYKVIIKNYVGVVVYERLVNAETENKAIIELLQNDMMTIYEGDTLTVELY